MIKVALVGCGGMASWHAEKLKLIPDCAVTALVDTEPTCTKTFRDKYFSDAKEFSSYEKMLDSAKPDAVVLVTPHTLHYPQVKAALEAGVHVLVEKPMVTNSQHAYDLWRTVNKTGKKLAIGFQAPYTAEYQCIKRMRDAGEIGKVQLIQGWLAQGWLKATAGKWRQDPKLSGGGQMYDSGAHVLNGMMWIMNDPVVEVACFNDNCGSPVDINGAAVLKFQNGAMGSVCIGGNSPGWDVNILVQSNRMVLKTAPHGGSLETTRDGKKFYPHVVIDERPAGGTPHLNFINAILGKEELQAPVRYGVLLSALMDALYESADTHKVVKVKPVPTEL
jgi:predicted dehydrogenase